MCIRAFGEGESHVKVCVASGKGGTGKTTVAANMALALGVQGEPVELVDCDVEEPNDHLLLKPVWLQKWPATVAVPRVDNELCDRCGVCAEVCQYHALLVSSSQVFLLPELCHSCGACIALCPRRAMGEASRKIGRIRIGARSGVRLIQGELTPGEAVPTPLVRQIKRSLTENGHVILDCPPGTSCPVVESIKGCDFCILVTEPTPFGLHDLELAVELLEQAGIPGGVVINRCDIGNDEVERFCNHKGIPILMCLPYDPNLARLYARGIPVVTVSRSWVNRFMELWDKVCQLKVGICGN